MNDPAASCARWRRRPVVVVVWRAMKTRRLLGFFFAAVLAACPQTSAPPAATSSATTPATSAPTEAKAKETTPSASAPAALAIDTPCTGETKLVPGIPGSPGHLIPSALNPNGVSELAQHMRTMQAALKEARTAIGKGEKVGPLFPAFRKIRCAWPTNPGDRNAAFDTAAQNYLAQVQALDAAKKEESASAYERVLDGCRACHEQSCGGAIPAIEALRMAKAEK